MESSPSIVANPVTSGSNRARESRRRKKKMKTHHQNQQQHQQQSTVNSNDIQKFSWKSETTQQLYSSKLLQALRQVRLSPDTSAPPQQPPSSSSSSPSAPPPPPSSAPRGGRVVREAADKALAVAARGRTRWSRAILTNKLRLKFLNKKLHRRQRVTATGVNRSPPQRKPRLEILKLKGKGNSLPAVQRKVKTLGRLVPGCRKEPLPVILEEATDYIPALEMQIRAMRGLLSLFSAGNNNNDNNNGGNGDEASSSSGPTAPENNGSI